MKLTEFRWLAAAAVGSMFAVGCVVTTGGPVEPMKGGSRVVSTPSKTKTTQPVAATPATPAQTGPNVTGIAPPVAQTVAPTTPAPTTAPPPATPPTGTTVARPPGIAPIPANTVPPADTATPAGTGTGAKRIAVPTATSSARIAVPGKQLAAFSPTTGSGGGSGYELPPAPLFPPLSRSVARMSSPSSQYPAISSDQPEGVQVRNTSH